MYRFCPSLGFFHPDVNAKIPAHAVAVSDERHAELIKAQSAGARIVPDDHGRPIAILRAGPTMDELWRRVRRERDVCLAASDWTQLGDAPLSHGERALCAAYRAALRAIPQIQADPASIIWPPAPIVLDR
ncbi:MAG: tail fiber assembly protein [Caulobacteraceae bacterium]